MASAVGNAAYNTLEEAVWQHDAEAEQRQQQEQRRRHLELDRVQDPSSSSSSSLLSSQQMAVDDDADATARKPPSRSKKAIAACSGAVVTSFLMTPFDVVKTRLQMQSAPEPLFVPSQHLGPPRAPAPENPVIKSARALGKQREMAPAASASNATCCKPTFFASNAQGDALTCQYDPRLDRVTSSFRAAAASPQSGAASSSSSSSVRSHQASSSSAPRPTPAAALQSLHVHGQPTQNHMKLSSSCAFPDRAVAKRVLLSGGTGTLDLSDFAGQQGSRQAQGGISSTAWNEMLGKIWARGSNPSVASSAGSNAAAAMESAMPRNAHLTGLWNGVIQVGKTEGIKGLWRGLTPTLLMTIPSQVTYMSCYDFFRTTFLDLGETRSAPPKRLAVEPSTSETGQGKTPVMPHLESVTTHSLIASLAAGALARSISATLVTPLELLRTRLQASSSRSNSSSGSGSAEHSRNSTSLRGNLRALSQQVSREGYTVLWRGLGSTLWRDVPFSAIYFAGYESMKRALTGGGLGEGNAKGHGQEFSVAFFSGATSGTLAAVVTHPFDLVKTRLQAGSSSSSARKSSSTLTVIRQIHQSEGFSGLFRGMSPRIAKVAPACGIMIASFEVVGRLLADA